jgi:hypothetical protein
VVLREIHRKFRCKGCLLELFLTSPFPNSRSNLRKNLLMKSLGT